MQPKIISMAQKKVVAEPKKAVVEQKKVEPANPVLFGRQNIIWMLIGLAIIALGLLLMIGGKSDDPNTFDPKEVYSTTRITIAPILIILGLGIEVYAIFRNPK